jgi:multidrug transporter EmrE-like cation transporter
MNKARTSPSSNEQLSGLLFIFIAYAAWTGIGAAGAIIVGTLFLDEPVSSDIYFTLI